MQNVMDMQRIDDLDDSILDAIRGMSLSDLTGHFASQVEQYLRVKLLYPYVENDLEENARRVLMRMIEMLNSSGKMV